MGRARPRTDSGLPRHCCPTRRRSAATAGSRIGGLRRARRWPREFGTPLFVYDEAHLRARCREAVAAFGDGVAYATKAFLCLAMARLAHEEGMHLDVATGGELHVALAAGVPGRPARAARQQQVASTSCATRATAGVGRIVVDSFDELDRLDALHAEDGAAAAGAHARPRPASRPTPTSSSAPARSTRSSASASRRATRPRAVARAGTRRAVELVGVHMHIGSQVFVADFFHEAVEVVAPFVRELGLPELSIGGGLGVAYVEGEEAPTITEWGTAIVVGLPRRRHHRPRHGRARPVDRRRRPPSPSTRSARSRTSPASAPTCRSTAA